MGSSKNIASPVTYTAKNETLIFSELMSHDLLIVGIYLGCRLMTRGGGKVPRNGRRAPDMTPCILNTPEAASYVKLSPVTMERKRLTGDGPPYVKIGKAVRYRRADLDAWLESRLIRSTSQVA